VRTGGLMDSSSIARFASSSSKGLCLAKLTMTSGLGWIALHSTAATMNLGHIIVRAARVERRAGAVRGHFPVGNCGSLAARGVSSRVPDERFPLSGGGVALLTTNAPTTQKGRRLNSTAAATLKDEDQHVRKSGHCVVPGWLDR
jgi:hypothetical protein